MNNTLLILSTAITNHSPLYQRLLRAITAFSATSSSKNCKKYAYVYFVNSCITKDRLRRFNELSEECVFVHKLVLCDNKVALNNADMLSLTLQQQHLKINEITNIHQSKQHKTSVEEICNYSDTLLDEIIDSSGCVLVYKSKLLSFRIFERQIVEALTHDIIPDTLQFINCNIPLLELSQLGKVISTSKCQWRCISQIFP